MFSNCFKQLHGLDWTRLNSTLLGARRHCGVCALQLRRRQVGILQTQLQGLGLLRPPSPAGPGNTGGARSGGSVRGPRGGGLFSPSFPDSHPASRAASQNLDGSGDLVCLPLLNCNQNFLGYFFSKRILSCPIKAFFQGCLHCTVGVCSPSGCVAWGLWHHCCTVAVAEFGW